MMQTVGVNQLISARLIATQGTDSEYIFELFNIDDDGNQTPIDLTTWIGSVLVASDGEVVHLEPAPVITCNNGYISMLLKGETLAGVDAGEYDYALTIASPTSDCVRVAAGVLAISSEVA